MKEQEDEIKKVQISPRIDKRLRDADKDQIRLENNGEYRNHFSRSIEYADRLKQAVWILQRPYELERARNEEFVDDPEVFEQEIIKSVQEVVDDLLAIQPQLEALAKIDPEDIDRDTLLTLPRKTREDAKSSVSAEAKKTGEGELEDLLRETREILNQLAADSDLELDKLQGKKDGDTDEDVG